MNFHVKMLESSETSQLFPTVDIEAVGKTSASLEFSKVPVTAWSFTSFIFIDFLEEFSAINVFILKL